jgi:hypothetical protein
LALTESDCSLAHPPRKSMAPLAPSTAKYATDAPGATFKVKTIQIQILTVFRALTFAVGAPAVKNRIGRPSMRASNGVFVALK